MTEAPAAAAGELALGDSTVNRIGLGARFIQDAEHSRPLLQRALELGVNLIDTADVYGNSENAIAGALHPYPEGLVIATKGGQTLVDGQPTADGRPRVPARGLRAQPARLRVDTIDLYQLHMPDPDVPLEESVGALAELRHEGKIREIGVSNVFGDAARARAPHGADRVGAEPLQPHAPRQRARDRDLRARGNRLHAVVAAGRRRAARQRAARRARSPGCCSARRRCCRFPGTASIEHLEENVARGRASS